MLLFWPYLFKIDICLFSAREENKPSCRLKPVIHEKTDKGKEGCY